MNGDWLHSTSGWCTAREYGRTTCGRPADVSIPLSSLARQLRLPHVSLRKRDTVIVLFARAGMLPVTRAPEGGKYMV